MIFAYLDPGAGSMLVQAVIAAALTVPFVLRSHLSRVGSTIRRRLSARSKLIARDG